MPTQPSAYAKSSVIVPRVIAALPAASDTPKSLGAFACSAIEAFSPIAYKFFVRVTVASAVVTNGSIQTGDVVSVVDTNWKGELLTATIESTTSIAAGNFRDEPPDFAVTGLVIQLENRFKRAIISGFKAVKTANAGALRVGFKDRKYPTQSTYPMPINIAAGGTFEYVAPEGCTFSASDIYYQVDTSTDGIMAILS